jgi:hypothetical protein
MKYFVFLLLLLLTLVVPLTAVAWDDQISNKVSAEMLLKSHLRDPDSYQSIGWTQLSNDLGIKTRDGKEFILPYPWSVWLLKYRAKNGFGGYSVDSQKFIFKGTAGFVPYDGWLAKVPKD